MRQFLFFGLFFFLGLGVQAQSVSNLTILKAVKENFPKSEEIRVTTRCSNYEATFFQNNEPVKACFNKSGQLELTTYLVEESDLPKAAREDLNRNFASLALREVLKKVNAQQEAEFVLSFQDNSRLFYDASGNRLDKYNSCTKKPVNY